MFDKILKIFNAKKLASLQDIQELKSLQTLQESYQQYTDVANQEQLEQLLVKLRAKEDSFSNNEVIMFLSGLFQEMTVGLQASKLDADTIQLWTRVLRELLVSINFTGDYLECANNIKKSLDESPDILKCTQQTKELLLEFSSSLTADHEELHGYLLAIGNKLQAIYSDINQAQDEYFSRESIKGSINNSFEKGLKQMGDSINNYNNFEELKYNLNNIVSALQNKIICEVEAEENETKLLENKIAGMSNKIKLLEDHAKDLEKKVRQKHLESITDPLTGLFNRAAYIQALEKAWMKWDDQKIPSTMLVWDIDHFKSINDNYGHDAGDKVLQSVARKLETGIRKGDILARFGGEEFVMLLTNKSLEEGMQIAERIRELISMTEFTYKKSALHVTISCGVSTFIKKDTPTSIFERADKALYKAKRGGRDRVETLKVA